MHASTLREDVDRQHVQTGAVVVDSKLFSRFSTSEYVRRVSLLSCFLLSNNSGVKPTNSCLAQAWRTSIIERPLPHVTRKWKDGMGSTSDGGGEDEDAWEKEMEQYGCSKPNNWNEK